MLPCYLEDLVEWWTSTLAPQSVKRLFNPRLDDITIHIRLKNNSFVKHIIDRYHPRLNFNSLLLNACAYNNTPLVKYIYSNYRDENLSNQLLYAIMYNRRKLIRFLYFQDHIIEPDEMILEAIMSRSLKTVKLVLELTEESVTMDHVRCATGWASNVKLVKYLAKKLPPF